MTTALDIDHIFAALGPDQASMLTALPYRAGLYVSFSDVSGGWTAQDRELQALADVLKYRIEAADTDDFCRALVMETLAARNDWPRWSHAIASVPAEAKALKHALEKILSSHQQEAFTALLIDTARAVATAFQEEDSVPAPERPSLTGMVRRALRRGDDFDPRAVSQKERSALDALQKALA